MQPTTRATATTLTRYPPLKGSSLLWPRGRTRVKQFCSLCWALQSGSVAVADARAIRQRMAANRCILARAPFSSPVPPPSSRVGFRVRGGAGDLSSGVLLLPLHIRTSAREGSVGVAVLPPRQSDGTFDCSFRDAEAKELSFDACSIAKTAAFATGGSATAVATLAVGLADAEVAYFEEAHAYCGGDSTVRVSHSGGTEPSVPIAIQSVAQFVTGDNDCAVFSSSVPVGTQMVQLFDIDRQTAGETIVHAVALVPVVSDDHFLLEDDEGELAHNSNVMTAQAGQLSEDKAEQGSELRKMDEEDDSPSETTPSAAATTTLPSKAADAFLPSLYPTFVPSLAPTVEDYRSTENVHEVSQQYEERVSSRITPQLMGSRRLEDTSTCTIPVPCPSPEPTSAPSAMPSSSPWPTPLPTPAPTALPTSAPSAAPSASPRPTSLPTPAPFPAPTLTSVPIATDNYPHQHHACILCVRRRLVWVDLR